MQSVQSFCKIFVKFATVSSQPNNLEALKTSHFYFDTVQIAFHH